MKLEQTAAPTFNPIAYEKVSVQEAMNAVADPRRVYHKNWHSMRLPGARVELLDVTARAWLLELPAAVRVVELARRFPRIANKLAELWDHPARCERYLTDLLVVRRGDSIRQGFPAAVARELTALSSFYTALHPAHADALEWN